MNLSSDCLDEELEQRYRELKNKYGEERFLPGDEGNRAAANLTELENAYKEIKELRVKEQAKRDYGSDYGRIDQLIKDGKYDEAQDALDAIVTRPAEWHYLQSIIYYKREWLNESKAQLQMAVNSEPWNDKYKNALDKMNIIMGNPKADPNSFGQNPNPGNAQPVNDGQVCGNACSNCCLAYCITDCCCTMTQCC